MNYCKDIKCDFRDMIVWMATKMKVKMNMPKAWRLFAISWLAAFFISGCDGYNEVDFPSIRVNTTLEMKVVGIYSKNNILLPIYISYDNKCLKLDGETTVNDTKIFFTSIGLECKEIVDKETVYHHKHSGEEESTELKHRIIAGVFDLEYKNYKLCNYLIRSGSPYKMIDGVKIGVSANELFSLPVNFDDIKKMFGHRYDIRRCNYK